MGIFSGYLMVSDLDGTFFGENSTVIPKRNIDAVNRFMSEGGKFSLATGRGVYVANLRTKGIPRNAPDLLYNGEMIFDFASQTSLFEDGIEDPYAREYFVELVERFPEVTGAVLCGLNAYCPENTEKYRIFLKELSFEDNYARFRDARTLPLPWFKMLFGCHDASRISEMTHYAEKIKSTVFAYVNSTPNLLEVTKAGVNKGTGLRMLAEMLNIDMSKTIAAGDYFNDKPMLDTAAYSFVPENGADELKRTATAVLCHHNNGFIGDIVDWLEEKL